MGASWLHEQILDECKSHIDAELECLVHYQTPDSEAFLCCVDTCWQAHSVQKSLIHHIMGSSLTPRVEGKPTPKLPKLQDMGLQLFREHLFRSPLSLFVRFLGLRWEQVGFMNRFLMSARAI
ncbi:hypothetical protein Pyn_15628 [Prunus yedoensis var. nudiflora]|uniref:Cullin N-terminal domain-containing protein n=1 Tax=Prunus yedoensis var. nudiflora TaxID=2094558 RepID=A0A315AV10_PRUYE|nr:hypothetical protein Pyn_15628 [Prunus yedoensis var. nudiflora]